MTDDSKTTFVTRSTRGRIRNTSARPRLGQEAFRAAFADGLPNRRHRSLIDIVGVRDELVIALIPGWNPRLPVVFALDLVPEELRADVKSDSYLLADINIGANNANDLLFSNFEVAPDPADIE